MSLCSAFSPAPGGSTFDPTNPGPIGGTTPDVGNFTRLNVSTTWNNAGTDFVGLYGRFTNTASGAGSKLIDLGTVADGSLFSVSKAGAVNAHGFYWTASTAYGFDDATGWGIGWKSNGDTVAIALSNVGQNQLVLQGAGSVGFSGATYPFADTALFRSASGRMALRNNIGYVGSLYPSVIAQAFEVYNTYTDGTNYERFAIDWQSSSNIVQIGTQVGGSGGTARDIEIVTDNTVRITIKASGEILLAGLPITYPGVSGQLWNDEGTVKITS